MRGKNPFIPGAIASGTMFIGRRPELNIISGRIINRGQSVAITAEPRMGKTSLLLELASRKHRSALYGKAGRNMVFQYIDAHSISVDSDRFGFWSLALEEITGEFKGRDEGDLLAAYEVCKTVRFSNESLNDLFGLIQSRGLRLVLLIDEFDSLVSHPKLRSADFLGGLRSLASKNESLALVIASRQTLMDLQESCYELSGLSSPYFNIMFQITLKPLNDQEVEILLKCGVGKFSKSDMEFLKQISGGHPYLLQETAFVLWNFIELETKRKGTADQQALWESIATQLLEVATPMFEDMWRTWSPEVQKIMLVISMDNLATERIHFNKSLNWVSLHVDEVVFLRNRGILDVHATRAPNGSEYRFQSRILLWWMVRKLIKFLHPRDDKDISEWITARERDGVLSRDEKKQMTGALKEVNYLVKAGAESFIKGFAEGIAKGLTGQK